VQRPVLLTQKEPVDGAQQLWESPTHVGVPGVSRQVRVTSPKVTRAAVDPAAAAALSAALEANAPYRVRVPTSVFGGSVGRWAMSSLPLRCLAHSDLQESFVLHLDDLGNIAALDYSTPSGECLVEEVLPPTKCDPFRRSSARRRSPRRRRPAKRAPGFVRIARRLLPAAQPDR